MKYIYKSIPNSIYSRKMGKLEVVVHCVQKFHAKKSLFMLVFSRKIYSSSIKCTKIHRQGAKRVIKWRNIKEKVFYLKKNIYFKQSFDDSSMYSTPRYTKCIYLLLFYFLYMHIWYGVIESLTGYSVRNNQKKFKRGL